MDPIQRSNGSDEEASAKRQRLEMVAVAVSQGDLGPATRFLPGSRIQVLWTLRQPKLEASSSSSSSPAKPAEESKDASSLEKVENVANGGDNGKEEEEEEDDDDEQMTDVWWSATVVGRTSQMHELPKAEDEEEEVGSLERLPIYEIRYDSMSPDFPNPELASICILDDHCLLSCDQNESLPWRHFGSTWEEKDEDEAHKDVPEGLKDLVTDLDPNMPLLGTGAAKLPAEDSLTFASAFVEDLINKLTANYKNEMELLPRSNQNAIVDKVVQVKEQLVQKLAGCLKETGKVSEEDAKRIVAELRST